MIKLIINSEFPSLNQIVAAAKKGNRNYQPYNEMKDLYTQLVQLDCKKQLKDIKFEKVFLRITWFCKNKKQDKDNIAVGLKFLLDGMVHAGVIENDGWKQVEGFSHKFEVDKNNPRVEVLIEEV